jgi:predicted Fe-Mo cluster-binding NifX family protein
MYGSKKEEEMIVAIVAEGERVSPHFGRSEGFILAEVDDGSVKSRSAVQAPTRHECGALAGLFAQHKVDTVIVGGIGAGAIGHLKATGIEVVSGAAGDIDEVLSDFIEGKLLSGDAVCSGDHDHSGQCHHHGPGTHH